MKLEELTREIIGAAIEFHKALGPGLLESAYEECLCHELGLRELAFERQRPLPVAYKSVNLDCGYGVDIVVEGKVSDWDRPLALPSPRRGEAPGRGHDAASCPLPSANEA